MFAQSPTCSSVKPIIKDFIRDTIFVRKATKNAEQLPTDNWPDWQDAVSGMHQSNADGPALGPHAVPLQPLVAMLAGVHGLSSGQLDGYGQENS